MNINKSGYLQVGIGSGHSHKTKTSARPRARGVRCGRKSIRWFLFKAPFLLVFAALWPGLVEAASLLVPNASFESPETEFADPRMDAWQKAPEPAWYMGGNGFPWDQLVGQFLNTTNGSPNHIENLDGKQAAFLFALPDVAIFQDYNTLSGTNSTPTHDFTARFEAGKSYALKVGLLGGGGGMSNGATFQISLYYRDANSNAVTVAATTITNTPDLFPTNTKFVDFELRTPQVHGNDAWAFKHIGIRLASTVGFDRVGGYWDLDNVRLTESAVPNGSFESPETVFADSRMEAWQKAAEPPWYQGGNGFPWDQLMGQFLNPTNGSPGRIENMDGKQAAFLFALPDVAIFQDNNTLDGSSTTPSHDFNVKFETGKSYALTVGLLGGGGGMSNGATFQISFYYRDANSNQVPVAALTITNTPDLFPTNTTFTDFQVRTPIVRSSDAWAGKNIGIRLASTVGFDLVGGYWDLDNVRLTESLIPNGSFESPETSFADPNMDAWQKSPEPPWYQGGNGFPWVQLMGQFLNPTNGSPNRINNMEGRQGAFLFALPDVALFQDYNSVGGTNSEPSHDFNVKFDTGKSYILTVGLLGGGGGMTNGATFEISLYYRDAASNQVTVAAITITNSPSLFSTNTAFKDFQVVVPTVRPEDAWQGRNLGIRLASTVGFDKQGGYWDIDDVRLDIVPTPALVSPGIVGGRFEYTLESPPGRYEVLASSDISLPLSQWTVVGKVSNLTGLVHFIDFGQVFERRFYRARLEP